MDRVDIVLPDPDSWSIFLRISTAMGRKFEGGNCTVGSRILWRRRRGVSNLRQAKTEATDAGTCGAALATPNGKEEDMKYYPPRWMSAVGRLVLLMSAIGLLWLLVWLKGGHIAFPKG
ncbi:hypothetical protein A3C67_03205 [Candidatus Nomurabacteria bacterium RIFCSPHIGHO2_02_FULL_42_19]|uniref:Uncharacterized protein n=1 Tax=Candidatus Nomurabacteria bacterium RIFCSPHIGHO2_02_FULL_42_19 TaxID=1801756 RepID=A0A1F6W2R5_9BACT|nr:MAG: hypothetical protein A3C67_03205 [Candidatus Nomurabacteria bacterium RIFCSPHIGHO2_02_FULL_42_19]